MSSQRRSRHGVRTAPDRPRRRHRAVLELDAVTKIYGAEPPVVALREVSFAVRARRAGRDRRAVGVGQVDAAARDGHARAAELGRGADHRPGRRRLVRSRAVGVARDADRLRLPAVLPRRAPTALENVADGLLYAGVAVARAPRAGSRGARAGRARGPRAASGRPSCRAASASASRSRARWSARPAIVLADEPTGNLDSATGAAIFALLEELHADGATIVVITHDRELAAAPAAPDRDARRADRHRHRRSGERRLLTAIGAAAAAVTQSCVRD